MNDVSAASGELEPSTTGYDPEPIDLGCALLETAGCEPGLPENPITLTSLFD